MQVTQFLSADGLRRIWQKIQTFFITKLEAYEMFAKKRDIATINGADITNGGNVSVLAIDTDTLTIDGSVSQSSTNPVSSQGVYNYCQAKLDGGFYVS